MQCFERIASDVTTTYTESNKCFNIIFITTNKNVYRKCYVNSNFGTFMYFFKAELSEKLFIKVSKVELTYIFYGRFFCYES